jgi:hypothetical protein
MVHSSRYAFKGGENLVGGRGSFTPKDVVKSWMHSKAGHREYLLSPRVRRAGVGMARRNGKMFVAWAFSDQTLLEPFKIKFPHFKIPLLQNYGAKGGSGMLRLPVKLALICASIFAIVLGAHGIWVYFSRLELLFGAEAAKLFLAIGIPVRLRAPIEWMSMKGLQSWFIPAVFIVVGLLIWQWQTRIDAGNSLRWLNKLHLW